MNHPIEKLIEIALTEVGAKELRGWLGALGLGVLPLLAG
jgi:hypothetical protein